MHLSAKPISSNASLGIFVMPLPRNATALWSLPWEKLSAVMTHPSNHSFSLAGQQHPSGAEHWIICVQINPLNWVFWATSIQQHLDDSASPYLKQIIAWDPCQERLYDTYVMDIKHIGAGINHHHIICHHFDVSCPQHKSQGANATWCKSKVLEKPECVTPANIPTPTVILKKTHHKYEPSPRVMQTTQKSSIFAALPCFLISLLYPALPFSHFLLLPFFSECSATLTQEIKKF